jgi:FO synthase
VHEGERDELGEAAGLLLEIAGADDVPSPVHRLLDGPEHDRDVRAEAHRAAHSVGLNSNVTIMFGAVEQPVHWARHMVRTRALQAETGGFTEFVPLPFVHMATPLYLQGRARRGPTFRETLLMHAVGRIAYSPPGPAPGAGRGYVDNVQVSWVKLGAEGARQILRAGANDLGGTLMDENISRAAGAAHGQGMDEQAFRAIVDPLGRPLEQRTTLYGRVAAVTS